MKAITYISILLLAITSCTRIIDLDLPDQPEIRLVVNGAIMHYVSNPDSGYQEIDLSKSRSFFDDVKDDYSVSGAVVKVKDLNTNEEVLFQESTTSKGLYFTNALKGIVGHAYELNIEATLDNELQTFQAIDEIVFQAPNVDSILLEPQKDAIGDNGGRLPYFVAINSLNNLANHEYFKFEVYIDDEPLENELNNPNFFFSLVDDAFFGDSISGFPVNDHMINEEKEDNINPPFDIEVKMQSISPIAYNYWRKLYVNSVSGTDTPQTEVRGTVNNLTYKDRYALGTFMCGSESDRTQRITQFPKL